nr:integrase, catalytic region, zinc finger, CCHC-type, peptidase aspartic, catalytic [Tanacetum cinerariifolium]
NPPYKFTWANKEVPISEGSSVTTTKTYIEKYKNVSQDIRDQLNAEAEAVQIILTGIDNDIYSIVDACPNAREMWKAIERLKQGESINVQDLETNLYWEFGKFTSRDGESLELYYSRFYQMMNELVRNQYDEMSKDKEIDKLMALISLSFKKIYKPTNNNLRTSSNIIRANQDNSLRINKGAGYDNQRLGNVAGARETVGITVVQKSKIQCYNCKEFRHVARECQKPKRVKDAAYHREKMLLYQELEAHYMYMAQIQEVSPDATDSGPIFDADPLQKVSNDDHYNVFAIESEHPEQSKSVHNTYPIEQDENNVIIDSLDISYDREQIDQNDDDVDLANERELLASLIEKLKCEIDDSKNRNKFLETSNIVLVEKLKGEIKDFKTKNKSLKSSNNRFKEANNKLSETNALMYTDLKKFKAELDRRNDLEYASNVEIDCVKAKGDLISYKMESQKSFNKYTQHINDLNQIISEMKKKLSAHQETISILSQAKEAQIKLYKTREGKELDKVIALENKVKVLDNIVYKTGQSVQTMNMLNRHYKTSFAKPEFLKKTQRVNPRLYDIGCYNDNLALILAPESDEVIRLEKESRSKLEKRMDESIPWDQKCKSSKELFKIKRSVGTVFDGVEHCEETIAKRTYFGHIDPFIQNMIEANFCPEIQKINADLENFHDLKAQLQDKSIAISELKKLIEKLKGKNVDTKFEKSSVIRQLNAFKSQRPSISGKPTIFSDSLERKDFSKSNTREPKRIVKQCAAKPLRKTVASESNQKPRNTTRKLYERIKIVLFIIDSGCSKHMTANLKLLINFVEKFLGTVKFGNDQIAPILGYGDLVQGAITIKRFYYVEGLNHNLFSVDQFCDVDLEVAFRKSTCYIRDSNGNDLLTGSHGINLYSITLQDTTSPNPFCLMANATSSQAWLWHRRLSHLNFDTINLLLKNDIVVGLPKLKFIKDHLCSSCELGKAK